MRVSLNWLRDFVDIERDPDQVAEDLTMLGLEIESVERMGEGIEQVVVGQVLTKEPHPDADKLTVCTTDIGADKPLTIVCGATNFEVGDKVPTAVVGATLPGGFAIGKRKMRGIESQGMMCSASELGLGEDHDGLLVLSPEATIGEDIRSALGIDDVVYEIEVTPNRADWAGMIGVARELSALYRVPLRLPDATLKEKGQDASTLSSVTIDAPDLCPRYAGRVLTEVTVGPSPMWLAQRLLAAGQRPINNLVDVTNYILLETGHPLHAFDLDRLKGERIVVRSAKQGETIKSIDGETRKLDPEMLVIADESDPVAIAGVMGGFESEVTDETKRVFLESAWFNPVSVRKTARALNMQTDSSQRFQRGADPEMVEFAINRAARLMAETAGAVVAKGLLDAYPKPFETRQVRLRFERCSAVLGMELHAQEQTDCLKHLGFEVASKDHDAAEFIVPQRRHDVTIEADLIEEVARMVGYDAVPSTLPRVRQSHEIFAPEATELRRLRDQLAGMGLSQMMNMSFGTPETTLAAGIPFKEGDMVALMNPLAETMSHMRYSLVPGILAALSRNLRRGADRIAAFEIGPVYRTAPDAELPAQSERLVIAMAGNRRERHWSEGETPVDFFDLRGIVDRVLDSFQAKTLFSEYEGDTLQPGQGASILLKKHPIGLLGEVHPSVRKAFDLDQAVFVAELELDALLSRKRGAAQLQPVSSFPPVLRDLAFLVDAPVPAGDLVAVAKNAGGKALATVEVMDVYTGKPIPEGKKSVALSLSFQSFEKTLTDQETDKACKKIIAKLETAHGAQLR